MTQTIAWSCIFFFASAGASSAYLTVSEIFPLEIRGLAIAFFYAIATGTGGITGPVLFGALAGTKHRGMVYIGDVIAAVAMAIAGVIELWLGISAEQESLEEVAAPLSTERGDERERNAQPEESAPTRHAPPPRRQRGLPHTYRRVSSPRASFAGLPAEGSTLEHEIDAIVDELERSGPLRRHELGARVGVRRWGPGCFSRALREARGRGVVVRAGRDRFASASRRWAGASSQR